MTIFEPCYELMVLFILFTYPFPTSIFVRKKASSYYCYISCIFSNGLQNTFIMEANTMNPDQTAPEGAA